MAAACSAVMEERRRLACEIHDTLAQAFTGILLHLEAVPETTAADGRAGSDLVERLARAKHLAKCGLEDSRRMLLGLRPKSLEGTSLLGALKTLAQSCAGECGMVCKFRFIGRETGFSPDVQDEFYRIAQEALCNARKHSHATSVSIVLSCEANMIALTIKDNGQGFVRKHHKTASTGFGLSSMRERALRIGGSMDIFSAPRRGTEVKVRVIIPGKVKTNDGENRHRGTRREYCATASPVDPKLQAMPWSST
jgi:signal transduction histidine kinase